MNENEDDVICSKRIFGESQMDNPRYILYLHNTIIHRVYPPPPKKKIYCIGIVLDFPWDIFMSQKKLKTANNDYAKFWVVKEVYYGICASKEYWKRHYFILTEIFG